MSFHIDIIRVKEPDGKDDYYEFDYSIDECVKNGWLDPETGIWTRQTVEAPDDDNEYSSLPRADPRCGQNLGLKLVEIDGQWLADFGHSLWK